MLYTITSEKRIISGQKFQLEEGVNERKFWEQSALKIGRRKMCRVSKRMNSNENFSRIEKMNDFTGLPRDCEFKSMKGTTAKKGKKERGGY